MAQVSVGQVENLEDAINTLQTSYESMQSVCDALIRESEIKVTECEAEKNTSDMLLNKARIEEMSKLAKMNFAIAEHAKAVAKLAAATASGNPIAVAVASTSVADTLAKLQKATQAFEQAKSNRMNMEQRVELANQALSVARELHDVVNRECSQRIATTQALVDDGRKRLRQAKDGLDGYLSINNSVKSFHEWLKWLPGEGSTIKPDTIKKRLTLDSDKLRMFLDYLEDRDPSFRSKVQKFRRQLAEANGSAEVQAIQLQMRKNFSGYTVEKLAEQALKSLGHNLETQVRSEVENGKLTIVDMKISNLRASVVLGRGERMYASQGESIAVELKSGRAEYLYSQKDHMIFQAAGHESSQASMVVCTRDVKDLSEEKEKELRDALRKAGSPLIGMLPRKAEIDLACWQLIKQDSWKLERGE